MAWFPRKPLIAAMLGRVDFHIALETGEEDDERFAIEAVALFSSDLVLGREAEAIDQLDVVRGDAGFFVQLAQGALDLGLVIINVTLGQIPAVGMPHEQELAGWIATEDQEAAGFDFHVRLEL